MSSFGSVVICDSRFGEGRIGGGDEWISTGVGRIVFTERGFLGDDGMMTCGLSVEGSSDGGIRRAPAERNSLRNFDAKSSSRPTKRPVTISISNIRPLVNSRSLWSSSSNELVEGEGVEVPDNDIEWM